MTKLCLLPLLGAVALIAACEAKIEKNGEEAGGNAVTAEGQAQDNMVSIDAPGFEMKVAIPDGVRAKTNIESDSELIYPGATMRGVHIAAGKGNGGAVEIRFATADAPAKVAAWYRDSARTGFTIDRETAEPGGTVFNGRETDGKDAFKLRLAPRDGGTEGTLSMIDPG